MDDESTTPELTRLREFEQAVRSALLRRSLGKVRSALRNLDVAESQEISKKAEVTR